MARKATPILPPHLRKGTANDQARPLKHHFFSKAQLRAITAGIDNAWNENDQGRPPEDDTVELSARTQPCHGVNSTTYGAERPDTCRECPSVNQCLGAVMTAELQGGNWPGIFAGMTEEQRARTVLAAQEAQREAERHARLSDPHSRLW